VTGGEPAIVPDGWTRLPDGRTVPAGDWAAGAHAAPAGHAGGELMMTTADGHTVPLDQWLQQGPMVLAPDGRRMTANAFAYHFGQNPDDPWVAVKDSSGADRMEHLSQYLAPSHDNPVVVTPDGRSMTVNAFFYATGANPADWVTYRDDKGRTLIATRSDFAQHGPILTTPGGQQMHEGRFVLDNPAPAGNPWVFVPTGDSSALVMSATDFQASIDEMVSLSRFLLSSAGDVLGVLAQMESDLSGIEGPLNHVHPGDGSQQLSWYWSKPDGPLATLTGGFRQLAQGLQQSMGDALAQGATHLVEMEQANVEGFTFRLGPAGRPRGTIAL
jgi:hypothetical protein